MAILRRNTACSVSTILVVLFGTVVLAYDNGLGLTPQMGWNPWNLFGCDNINETLIKEIAEAMVSTGLSALGYEYINLDDCWQVSRNDTGHIVEDFKKFPSGMAGLSDYVRNDLGLKFGLYSDSGLFTCQRRPGSYGYERQDAASYVEWDIDYLKYDNCFATGLGGGVQKRYATMRDALNQTTTKAKNNHAGNEHRNNSKPIFFGLCEWGIQDPATWAGAIGNSWRTTGDIRKSWAIVVNILDANDKWHEYAGPGGWNDPDMLQVGTTDKLTLEEQRSHFTLWALIKAPLLLANDLRSIPDDVFEIISNPEIIALNQDPLGIQGYKRAMKNGNNTNARDGLEVWAGDLDGGDIAVVLFNRSPHPEIISVRFDELLDEKNDNTETTKQEQGNPTNGPIVSVSAHVRDLWARADLGVHRDRFEGGVPSHGVMALRLSAVAIIESST